MGGAAVVCDRLHVIIFLSFANFFLFPKRQSKGARGFIEWLRYTAAHVTRGYNLLEN